MDFLEKYWKEKFYRRTLQLKLKQNYKTKVLQCFHFYNNQRRNNFSKFFSIRNFAVSPKNLRNIIEFVCQSKHVIPLHCQYKLTLGKFRFLSFNYRQLLLQDIITFHISRIKTFQILLNRKIWKNDTNNDCMNSF